MCAAVLAAAGAPVSSSFEAVEAVSPPPAVETHALPSATRTPIPAAEPAGGRRAVVDKTVHLRGRRLALCLVRSGSAGMAVLSVPQDSAVPGLPDIPAAEFLALVSDASGCRPDGEVREVAGRRGTIALSAGLDCSGAGT